MSSDGAWSQSEARIAALEAELRAARDARDDMLAIVNRGPAVVVLWRLTPDVAIDFVSDGIGQFGYTPDDFTTGRTTWQAVTHPDDQPRMAATLAAIARQERHTFTKQYRVYARDGAMRWVEDRTVVAQTREGRPVQYQSLILDITRERQAQEALAAQLAFQTTLLDAIPVPIFYKDTAGIYQGANDAFARFTGRPREAIIGKTVYDVAPPELATLYDQADRALLAQPGAQEYETRVRARDGAGRTHGGHRGHGAGRHRPQARRGRPTRPDRGTGGARGRAYRRADRGQCGRARERSALSHAGRHLTRFHHSHRPGGHRADVQCQHGAHARRRQA